MKNMYSSLMSLDPHNGTSEQQRLPQFACNAHHWENISQRKISGKFTFLIWREIKHGTMDVGFCFIFGDSLVSWQKKKQIVVICVVEYCTLVDTTAELLGLYIGFYRTS